MQQKNYISILKDENDKGQYMLIDENDSNVWVLQESTKCVFNEFFLSIYIIIIGQIQLDTDWVVKDSSVAWGKRTRFDNKEVRVSFNASLADTCE